MRYLALLILLVFVGASCEKIEDIWTPIVIKEGTHAVSPSYQQLGSINKLDYYIEFGKGWTYNLHDNDQLDWCKVGGLSLNIYNNHINSAMWSVRYDTLEEHLEFGFYTHQNGEVVKLKNPTPIEGQHSEVWLTAPVGDSIRFVLNRFIDNKILNLSIIYAQDTVETNVEFNLVPILVREIGMWFGGNRPAPSDMHGRIKSNS